MINGSAALKKPTVNAMPRSFRRSQAMRAKFLAESGKVWPRYVAVASKPKPNLYDDGYKQPFMGISWGCNKEIYPVVN